MKTQILGLCLVIFFGASAQGEERRLVGKEEIRSQRGPNTRVWENSYEVDVLDPITQEPTGEKRIERERYYEKATNLCYQTAVEGVTQWMLTDPAFKRAEGARAAEVSYEVQQSRTQVAISPQFNDSYHVSYAVGDTTIRFGMAGIGLYERTTGRLVMVKDALPVGPIDIAPDQLRYTNAFPGCDVEYENSLSEFKQLVKLHGLGSVPDPQQYGLDPKSTYFVIVSRLNLHELDLMVSAGDAPVIDAVEGDDIAISLQANGEEVCAIIPGFAWDATEKPPFAQPVFKRLIREKDQTTLLEGVPYSWLIAPEREFPVTIDYVLKNASQVGDEVWRSGITYHVSNAWWVQSNNTLVIEPGAIIKLGSSGVTSASIRGPNYNWQAGVSGRIRAVGTKFNYIVVTSWRDDSLGEDVSPPGSGKPAFGDYACFVEYAYAAYNDPAEFGYLKIRYATSGLVHGSAVKVHDSIFRDCYHGLTLYGYADPDYRYIANNLFTNCRVSGITVLNWGGPQIYNVENNTFATNLRAIWFLQQYTGQGDAQNAELRGYNNLITDVTHSLNFAVETTGWKGTYDGSAFLNTAYSSDCIFEASIGSPTFELGGDPYDSRKANGSYYLDYDTDEGDECRDNGTTPSVYTRSLLAGKTVTAPTEITANIVQDATWQPLSSSLYNGSGDAAIGYHYDRVDYVIGNSNGNYQRSVTADLRIKPGVVVTYWRDRSHTSGNLSVSSAGSVVIEGTPASPILFTSVYVTGDQVSAPTATSSFTAALDFDYPSNPALSSPISSIVANYSAYGILAKFASGSDPFVVQDSAFQHCEYGVILRRETSPGVFRVRNSLFVDCDNGCQFTAHGADATGTVEFSTFDRCNIGLKARAESSPACAMNVVPRYSIFTGCTDRAMRGNVDTGSNTIIANPASNLYWNNFANIDGTYFTSTGSNALFKNPKFVAGDAQTYGDAQAVPDGYYLSQNADDYSVTPLRAKGITDVTPQFSSYSGSGLVIMVMGYEYLSAEEFKYSYHFNTPPDKTTGDSDEESDIVLHIYINGSGSLTFQSGDYIDLRLDTGVVVRARLPVRSYTNSSGNWMAPLWVAVDGSTFWGLRNASGDYVTTSNQDAVYAMRYDNDAPAGSANASNIDDSTALNRAPVGWWSTGATSIADASDVYAVDLGYHYSGSVIFQENEPVISVDAPDDGDWVKGTININASLFPEMSTISRARIRFASDTLNNVLIDEPYPDDEIQTSKNTSGLNGLHYSIIAEATDEAGYQVSNEIEVHVDNIAPPNVTTGISIANIAQKPWFYAVTDEEALCCNHQAEFFYNSGLFSSDIVTVTAAMPLEPNPSYLVFQATGPGYDYLSPHITTPVNGVYSWSYTLSSGDDYGANDAYATFFHDKAENVVSVFNGAVPDTTDPVIITPIVPASGSWLRGPITFGAAVEDEGAGVKSVSFQVMDGAQLVWKGAYTVTEQKQGQALARAIYSGKGLIEGKKYDIVVTATDNVNNVATAQVGYFRGIQYVDQEFTKSYQDRLWLRLSADGKIHYATEAKALSLQLCDLSSQLQTRTAVAMELVRAATSLIHWELDHVLVMDNEAYVYDVDVSTEQATGPKFMRVTRTASPVVPNVTQAVDFKRIPGTDEYYVLDAAAGGAIKCSTNVIGYPLFASIHPWTTASKNALSFDLVLDATGNVDGAFVTTTATSGNESQFYRLKKTGSPAYTEYLVDDTILPATGAATGLSISPQENILLYWQDDNRDGTGTAYYYNRRQMASNYELKEASQVLSGIPLSASMDFDEWAYEMENFNWPHKPTITKSSEKIQFIWTAGVPLYEVSEGQWRLVPASTKALNYMLSFIGSIEPATPDAQIEHVINFEWSGNSADPLTYSDSALHAATIVAASVAAYNQTHNPDIKYYFKAWGPLEKMIFRTSQDVVDTTTIDDVANDPYFLGFSIAESYWDAPNTGGMFRVETPAGTTERAYLDAIMEAARQNNRKVIWWEHNGAFYEAPLLAHYITTRYLNNPDYGDVIVPMHEDFSTFHPELESCYGQWLADSNRKDWGVSMQGWWWDNMEGVEYDLQLVLTRSRAQSLLGISSTDSTLTNPRILRLGPGIDAEQASWADMPPDIITRGLVQYCSLGARFFEIEYPDFMWTAPVVWKNPISGQIEAATKGVKLHDEYTQGISNVLNLIKDRKFIVPDKERTRSSAKFALGLEDVSKKSANPNHDYYVGELANNQRTGLFMADKYPDFNIPSREGDGFNVFDKNYYSRVDWIGSDFERGFQAADLATGADFATIKEDFDSGSYTTVVINGTDRGKIAPNWVAVTVGASSSELYYGAVTVGSGTAQRVSSRNDKTVYAYRQFASGLTAGRLYGVSVRLQTNRFIDPEETVNGEGQGNLAFGIDPTGGTDYSSGNIEWVTNPGEALNLEEYAFWKNYSTSFVATSSNLTVWIKADSDAGQTGVSILVDDLYISDLLPRSDTRAKPTEEEWHFWNTDCFGCSSTTVRSEDIQVASALGYGDAGDAVAIQVEEPEGPFGLRRRFPWYKRNPVSSGTMTAQVRVTDNNGNAVGTSSSSVSIGWAVAGSALQDVHWQAADLAIASWQEVTDDFSHPDWSAPVWFWLKVDCDEADGMRVYVDDWYIEGATTGRLISMYSYADNGYGPQFSGRYGADLLTENIITGTQSSEWSAGLSGFPAHLITTGFRINGEGDDEFDFFNYAAVWNTSQKWVSLVNRNRILSPAEIPSPSPSFVSNTNHIQLGVHDETRKGTNYLLDGPRGYLAIHSATTGAGLPSHVKQLSAQGIDMQWNSRFDWQESGFRTSILNTASKFVSAAQVINVTAERNSIEVPIGCALSIVAATDNGSYITNDYQLALWDPDEGSLILGATALRDEYSDNHTVNWSIRFEDEYLDKSLNPMATNPSWQNMDGQPYSSTLSALTYEIRRFKTIRRKP